MRKLLNVNTWTLAMFSTKGILIIIFLCYNLFMGYRTYEADKDGRITIYPSLSSSARKNPGILKTIIKKLIDVLKSIGKNSSIQKV